MRRLFMIVAVLMVFVAMSLTTAADFSETARIETFAGAGTPGYSGDGGLAINAQMNIPQQLMFDANGNVFIADRENLAIRRIDAQTGIITTVAGGGSSEDNGIPATQALLVTPAGVAVDSAGNIYISEAEANRVRKVDAQTGLISLYAGTGVDDVSDGDDGLAVNAGVDYPQGLSLDTDDNLYIAEFDADKIRRIDVQTGIITTVAGTGGESYTGDGGPATSATLNDPWDVFVDANDNIYIADFDNFVIRKVDGATGIITTVAGNGNQAFGGDGGPATQASLNWPVGVFADDEGDIYIADGFNQRVRVVDSETGNIRTLAGTGNAVTSGDGGLASAASFNGPADMWLYEGDLYVVEVGGNVIRRIFEFEGADYPVQLAATGDLSAAPVAPILTWTHQTEAGQADAPADTYQVYLHKDEGNGVYTQILYKEYGAGVICTGINCTLDLADELPNWGLLNGDYEWWVGAYYNDGAYAWSGGPTYEPATFSVTVPAATLPAEITNDPRQGRPLFSWADDGNTLWAQVWIGPNPIGQAYYQWIERDGDPSDNIDDFACAENVCTFAPPIDYLSEYNPYQVWMQFWSPGGFSTGGTDAAGAPSWKRGDDLNLPTTPPDVPTGIVITQGMESVQVEWDGMANATWYKVEIIGIVASWSPGYDLGEDCGNATGRCSLTYAGPLITPPYSIRLQAWGPGGFSEHIEPEF